jgi:hypothetical protein
MDVAVKVPRLQRLNALQLHGLRTEIAIMRYPHIHQHHDTTR